MNKGCLEIKIKDVEERELNKGTMVVAELHVECHNITDKTLGCLMAQLFVELADKCENKRQYLKHFAMALEHLT